MTQNGPWPSRVLGVDPINVGRYLGEKGSRWSRRERGGDNDGGGSWYYSTATRPRKLHEKKKKKV